MSGATGYGERLAGTFRYCASDVAALFIGGLFFTVPVALMFVPLLLVPLAARDRPDAEWLIVAAIAGSALCGLVLAIVPGGYIIRCLRARLAGAAAMPPFFGDLRALASDSGAFAVILLAYAAGMAALFALFMAAVLILPLTGATSLLCLVGVALMLMAIVLFTVGAYALYLFFFLSLAVYARSDSLIEALSPLSLVRTVRRDPGGYLIAALVLVGINTVIQLPALLLVTMPWLLFFQLLISACVVAEAPGAIEQRA